MHALDTHIFTRASITSIAHTSIINVEGAGH